MVGADIANISANFQEKNTRFSINLNPKAAFFIRDNVALGPTFNLGIVAQKQMEPTFTYGIGAFGRKYLGAAATNLTRTAKMFLEANAGIAGENNENSSTNGLNLGFGPGVAYFLTSNIALEALAKYDLTIGFGESPVNNAFRLGLGFQIYLPSKHARQITTEPLK